LRTVPIKDGRGLVLGAILIFTAILAWHQHPTAKWMH
jgi:hypothetical protein